MSGTLNDRIKILEKQISDLQTILQDLVDNIQEKYPKPLSLVGKKESHADVQPIGLSSGMGRAKGSFILWNSTEVDHAANSEPDNPEDEDYVHTYNLHSHSRYNGGALVKDVLEIVEYDWGSIINKHSPQFWQEEPSIATEVNSNGVTVEKIGQLDVVFNADTEKWGVTALEIDVKKCYLIERDDDGNIATDANGNEKKSPLYNKDQTKTAVKWDENAKVWRFYAVYAPGS